MELSGIEAWLRPDESLGLNNCDREAIHIPGSVQSLGMLVALDDAGTVRLASENVHERFDSEQLVALTGALRPLCASAQSARSAAKLKVGDARFMAVAHAVDGLTVVELEPDEDVTDGEDALDVGALADLFAELSAGEHLGELFSAAARYVQTLIGFDRVMGYVFDSEGHGSVVAEVRRDEQVDSFLGLRFPNTDIPKQARRLYALEWVRQVVDIDAPTSPIVPEYNPISDRPLNMAFCQLRAVSPIHLEYLRNMGVVASFSVSVVVDGELVALIACHHSSPRHISYERRRACELIGRHLSQRLEYLAARDDRAGRAERLSNQVELLSQLAGKSGLQADNGAWRSIAAFVEADDFLVSLYGKRVSASGSAWGEELWTLGTRFAAESPNRHRGETELRRFEPEGPEGGLLLVPIPQHGWLAWYRGPVDLDVVWAGGPAPSENKDLTPRSSFAAYKETIRGKCKTWTEVEEDIADFLRRGLSARFVEVEPGDSFEQTLRQTREYLEMLEESNKQLSESNEDLRQFAYAASHDFKAPLRTIRSFLPMIEQEVGPLSDQSRRWFNFIRRAADNLHRLQSGLWAFSRVNKEAEFESVDLNVIVENVVSGLAADLSTATVTVRPLPTVHGIPEQIETLFRNLLENASKYRSPERELHIVVEATRGDVRGSIISISDNGIGFPPSAEERIFELFSRLHVEHKDGDGLGLAMCRRIVNHHGGWIRAKGEPGSGATFELNLRHAAKGEP